MLWQDYILTIGSLVFSIALVPAIIAREKPPLSTSVPTFFFLYLFCFIYATLHLWMSSFTSALTATLWLILAIQRFRAGRKV
jgi:type VI protein secretion system component VasF